MGPVLKNLISSFNLLLWVIIWQLNLFSAGVKNEVFFSGLAAGDIWCTAPLPLKTRTFIPKRCASSLLSCHPVMPVVPGFQNLFLQIQSTSPILLLLKQICKQLRKDKNTARKKKVSKWFLSRALFFYHPHSSAVQKKQYKGKKNKKTKTNK